MTAPGPLDIPDPRTLAIFIDETGHEALAPGHDCYALGGVAMLAEAYSEVVMPAWREVRRNLLGDADAQLHAADFGHSKPSKEQFNVLDQFFSIAYFCRFAVAATRDSTLPPDLSIVETVMGRTRQLLEDLAGNLNIHSIALIVESSERANPLVERNFGALQVEQNGHLLQAQHCFLEKSRREPGLEIADFVVNAAGSMTRSNLLRNQRTAASKFPKDFLQVFDRVPRKLAGYLLIANVTRGADGQTLAGQQAFGELPGIWTGALVA